MSAEPQGLTSFALSLLLVFRTNSSYGRFDEARKIWGGILNRARNLANQVGTAQSSQFSLLFILANARFLYKALCLQPPAPGPLPTQMDVLPSTSPCFLCLDLAQAVTFIPANDVGGREAVGKWTVGFCRALQAHLQEDADLRAELQKAQPRWTQQEIDMLCNAQHRYEQARVTVK